MSKRKQLFHFIRIIRYFFFKLLGNHKKHIIIDCPNSFHYFHIEPIIKQLIEHKKFIITLIRWNGFESEHLMGVRYIDRDMLEKEIFTTYDIYLTTEFGYIPWWFNKVCKVFMLHGIGPKVKYFASPKVKDFNIVFSPGPYIEKEQQDSLRPGTKVFRVGLPATDTLVNDKHIKLPSSIHFKEPKPVLLYAPSWSSNVDYISMDNEIIHALANQDICNVIIRPHPLLMDKDRCNGIDFKKEIEDAQKVHGNIQLYTGEKTSIYDIIRGADILLGDISSVSYEFLLLDRPIIMYMKKGVKEFYNNTSDYIQDTTNASSILETPEALTEILNECLSNKNHLSNQRKKLLDRTLYNPGNATSIAVESLSQLPILGLTE